MQSPDVQPDETLLVTGAAGNLGTLLRPRLAAPGRVVRLLDTAEVQAGPGEDAVVGSVTDPVTLDRALDGVDAVVHLAAQATESSWEHVSDVNIHGTYSVLEACRRAGVRRAVIASSHHVVGFYTPDAFPVGAEVTVRPDTYYGVSKAAGEALGALYHDRYGLDVVCLRILSCTPRPTSVRHLSTWLSPDDLARLVEASLSAHAPGFRVVYGVSDNTRGGWVDLEGARALGYRPQDDAEAYAGDVAAVSPSEVDEFAHLGGAFCDPGLDAPLHADPSTSVASRRLL